MGETEVAKIEKQWLNEREVAAMLCVSLSKLRQDRFKCRGITYSKMGKSVRYAVCDVLDYMEGLRVVTA